MTHLKEYLACLNTQKISWHQFSKAQENSALTNHVYISNTICVNTQKVVYSSQNFGEERGIPQSLRNLGF